MAVATTSTGIGGGHVLLDDHLCLQVAIVGEVRDTESPLTDDPSDCIVSQLKARGQSQFVFCCVFLWHDPNVF